ncbi:iron ABC transporter permease [Proteinivorax hydrogeniformans]|uniref:Iron ABC transporter permease n=1 Tax=Proteinivorax hydrogeniformans TaxID=1826727 RepID=A0AAU8HT17_9FIRM
MRTLKCSIGKHNEYYRYIAKKWLFLVSLVIILLAAAIVSISVGSSGIPISEVLRALFGFSNEATSQTIVWNVRMPRVATAVSVGIALAMAGCVMQSVLRNPLASASTLGVSQGASFGASIAIVYFQAGAQISNASSASISVTNPYTVATWAFLGGISTTLVILMLSRVSGVSPAVMILAGVALSSMFTGATTLIQYFSDDDMVASIVYWTFGNLGRAGWKEISLIFILSVLAFFYFFLNRWNYNAMESGANTAKSLGVNVDRLILVSMSIATLISATAIAFVGTISFIGLIAPHIVRRFVGSDYRFLIPCSALMGGVIMLLADIASRMIKAPAILPIGAITSFLGGPLFLYLIIKQRKKRWVD